MTIRMLLPLLLLMMPVSGIFSQTEIITNSGEKYCGFIISTGASDVIMNTLDGSKIKIPNTTISETKKINSEIITTTGIVYEGELLSIDNNNCKMCTKGGAEINIENLIIKKIRTENGFEIYFDQVYVPKIPSHGLYKLSNPEKAENIKGLYYLKNAKNNNSFAIGFSLFSPGGINCILSYNFEITGLRAVAGVIHGLGYGIQCNHLLNISKNDVFEQNISYGVGYLEFKNDFILNGQKGLTEYKIIRGENEFEGYYFGLFYDLRFKELFLETGLTKGSISDGSPAFAFQLGYVHRLD